MKKTSLGEIAEIGFGYYAEPSPQGNAYYLQVRQFSETGDLIVQPELLHIGQKNENHILTEGNVLFVGKGNRIFSWCYRETDRPAIASSSFFVLRVNNNIIHSEYLAAILNAPQNRTAFLQIGSGTSIFSIRKSELSAFEIPMPSLSEQKRIAVLAELHKREVALMTQLLEQKKQFYTAIISKLIK